MNIYKNQTKPYRIKNCSFIAVLFTVMLTGATDDVAITKPGFDPSKVKVKAIKYHREGVKDRTIYEGDLYIAALGGAFYESTWDRVYANSANYSHLITLVDGAANKETAVAQYKLQLPIAENCTGEEYVEVTIHVQNDAPHATVDGAASYIKVSEEKVVANPDTKGRIETFIIDTNETTFKKALGDNVKKVMFINIDKTSILLADALFTAVQFSSDRLSWNKTYEEILCERDEMFEEKTQAEDRDQSFCLVDAGRGEFDNVEVVIDMVNEEIVQGKNFLYVEYWDTDDIIVQKSRNRAQKHQAKFRNKVAKLIKK